MSPGLRTGYARGCILVVDDDAITRLFLQEMLQQAGYHTDVAGNGKEAISALESKPYDLVLMDCNMPIMDGFETTRLVRGGRSDSINPGVPIIALSGSVSDIDQLRCREAGMNTCLSKPVEAQVLIDAIERYLDSGATGRPISQRIDPQGKPRWNDGFLDSMLAKFLAEVPLVMAGLQQAVDQGDLLKLESMGHKLRGAADILEASSLSVRSKALENAGKAGDFALAGRLASELITELHKLATALKE